MLQAFNLRGHARADIAADYDAYLGARASGLTAASALRAVADAA